MTKQQVPGEKQALNPPSFTKSWSLFKLMSIKSVMLSNHLILCHPLILPPSIFPSIRVFSSESVLHIQFSSVQFSRSVMSDSLLPHESQHHIRWSKYWNFSFNISPFNEYSGLISFRMDWFDLLVVHGTLQSLLQHHSSKASIL